MRHMGRCLAEMRRRGAASFEPTPEAQERFMQRMRSRAADTVFSAGSCATANSYYFNQHGEATLLRLSSTMAAARRASGFPLDDYRFA
jgi:hypothetical protein